MSDNTIASPAPPFAPPAYDPPPRGMLLSAALWGFFTGTANILPLLVAQWLPTDLFMVASLMTLSLLILPISFLGWWLISPTWPIRYVVFAATLFSFAWVMFAYVALAFQRPPSGPLLQQFHFPWLFGAVLALITALIWTVTYSVRSHRYLSALQRFPLRCYACGYDLSGLEPSAHCPECSHERRQHHWPAGWTILPPRLRRVLLIVMLVLITAGPVIYTIRWRVEALPFMRLCTSLGSSEFVDLPVLMPGDNPDRLGGRGVIVRFPDSARRALYIVKPRGKTPGLPAVRIWLTEMEPISTLAPTAYAHRLIPPVVCDLNPAQADRLFRDGLPPSLANAMKAAGANSKLDFMWIHTEDLAPPPPTAIRIDAAPHFP